jgi:acetyltransferase-like isoleucine patch superfamily enzyme
MKTTFADILLIGGCVGILLSLSAGTTALLSYASPYRALTDAAVFLAAYGVYSMLLLGLIRYWRPYPIGRFNMESRAVTYWKLNAVLVDLAQKTLHPFTTVFTETLLHSGFGARCGRYVAIAGVLRDHPLLKIGDGATIGQNSVLTAHAITHDEIVLAPIVIGANAVVGINCTVMPGVELGEGAVLAPGAVATIGTKIPARELWGGVPARKLKDLSSPEG